MNVRSAKNFSTCCVSVSRLLAFLLLGATLSSPCDAAKKKRLPASDELFNPLLGIDYSHWLVGPIVRIATEEEIAEYLRLPGDEEAQRFIEKFWERRNEGTDFFKKTPQETFEQRLVEADKRFTEGTYPGSRTDRGTVFILFGEADEVTYSKPQDLNDPTVEEWVYSKEAAAGLGGEKPDPRYRFFKLDDLTVFYTATVRAAARRRNRRRIRPNAF